MKRLGAGLFVLCLLMLCGCTTGNVQPTESPMPTESIESEAPTIEPQEVLDDHRGILGSHGTDIRMGLTEFGLEEAPISLAPEYAKESFACTSTTSYQDTLLGVTYDYSLTMDSKFQIIGASFGVTNESAAGDTFTDIAKSYLGFCSTIPYDSADSTQARAWLENNLVNAKNGESASITIGDAKFELYGTASGDGVGALWMDISKHGGESSDDKSVREDNVILPDEDGFAMGYAGDTLRTAFFEMTINDPYTCAEFDGLTPGKGYKFLVAELTLYNHTNYSQPIFDTDFEVIWDLDDDDAWAWPESDEVMGEDGEIGYFVKSEEQLPVSFDLGIHKTVTGILLYQVPVDSEDYFIEFYEVYDDDSEEGKYGDAFYVRFSA